MTDQNASWPGQPQRRVVPWAPAVTSGAVLLALIAGAVFTEPRSSAPPVDQWLPADGQRVLFAQDGVVGGKFAEWSRPDGGSLIQSNLLAFPIWFSKSGIKDLSKTQFLHLRAIQADAAGASIGQQDRLWTVEPDGLRAGLEVDVGPAAGEAGLRAVIMAPGRLDLPSDVMAGDRWVSSGKVWTWDVPSATFVEATYRATFAASAGTAGCLDVTMRQEIDADTTTATRTWCQGRGITVISDATGEWRPTDAVPAATFEVDKPFDWAGLDAMSFRPMSMYESGAGGVVIMPVSPPGLLGGGAVFAGKLYPDVLGVATGAALASVVWAVRPGGTLTASATLNGITVVATTERQLVAYNAAGRWLWQVGLPDVSDVPPVWFQNLIVVATLDGSVMALDPATGKAAWTANLGAEIRAAPLPAGDRLLVANQAGVLTCLDSYGWTLWAMDAGVPASMAVSPGDNPVVVFGENNTLVLVAYSVADGRPVWRRNTYQNARQLFALDSVVALRDNDVTIGLDWRTGQQVWRWDARPTAAGLGGGDRLLLLTDTDVVLLAGDGQQVRTWPHDLGHVTATYPVIVASDGVVLVYSANGVLIGGAP